MSMCLYTQNEYAQCTDMCYTQTLFWMRLIAINRFISNQLVIYAASFHIPKYRKNIKKVRKYFNLFIKQNNTDTLKYYPNMIQHCLFC